MSQLRTSCSCTGIEDVQVGRLCRVHDAAASDSTYKGCHEKACLSMAPYAGGGLTQGSDCSHVPEPKQWRPASSPQWARLRHGRRQQTASRSAVPVTQPPVRMQRELYCTRHHTGAHHLHGRQLGHNGVREDGNLREVRSERYEMTEGRTRKCRTFLAFIFLRSIPTSRVTPSPNRRLDAATYSFPISSSRRHWRVNPSPRTRTPSRPGVRPRASRTSSSG